MAISHFKINEPSVRTTVKKETEIHEAITAAMIEVQQLCTFSEILFNLLLKMQLSCGCKIAITKAYLCTLILFEKKQSHYKITQSKREVKVLKLENLMPVKDGLIISERNLTFKIPVKQEKQLFLTQRQHPDATKIITEEKGYMSEQGWFFFFFFFFNVDKMSHF